MIYDAEAHTDSITIRFPLHQATGLTVWVWNPGRGKRFSLLQKHPDRLWGPSSLLCNGYRGSSQGIKQPGREFDNSPPSSDEVKNEWSYTSAPIVWLHWMDRDSFAFTFYLQLSSDSTNALFSLFFVYADTII